MRNEQGMPVVPFIRNSTAGCKVLAVIVFHMMEGEKHTLSITARASAQPISNLSWLSIAPISRMLELGLNVGSAPTAQPRITIWNMFEEIRLASFLAWAIRATRPSAPY
jgi:cytosine/adenosine deaminase-related metal-dependent hydrolase